MDGKSPLPKTFSSLSSRLLQPGCVSGDTLKNQMLRVWGGTHIWISPRSKRWFCPWLGFWNHCCSKWACELFYPAKEISLCSVFSVSHRSHMTWFDKCVMDQRKGVNNFPGVINMRMSKPRPEFTVSEFPARFMSKACCRPSSHLWYSQVKSGQSKKKKKEPLVWVCFKCSSVSFRVQVQGPECDGTF